MSLKIRCFAVAVGMAALQFGTAAVAQDEVGAGKKLFNRTAVPACSVCHTLKDAGAVGEIGPNLDELKPDASRVEKAIRNGIGQMPAFTNLSDEQVKLLSKYVAGVTGAK